MKRLAPKWMIRVGRDLRQRETTAESLLWEQIRERRLDGLKFRRQYPVPDTVYVVDFYCHESRLIVELDGPIHEQQQPADSARQQHLESLGYHILRFSNAQVFTGLDSVLTTILDKHRAVISRP